MNDSGDATTGQDIILAKALQELADAVFPGVHTALRRILPEDGNALTQAEQAAIARAVPSVKSASGAARIAARRLMMQLGVTPGSLVKRQGRGPIWPAELSGSLSHDPELAAAAVGRRTAWRSIGIDIEPAEALPAEMLKLVATASERTQLNGDLVQARLLFCIKEAVFKATHPLDNVFLEHHDVEVDLRASIARTTSGCVVAFATLQRGRLIALAAIAQAPRAVSPVPA